MTYKVELIHSEEGYSVRCPDLRGCCAQGETEEEALANIASAIKDWLEVDAEMRSLRQVRYVEVPLAS